MKPIAEVLCREAGRFGLRLEHRGDKLAVIPADRCPPEFADLLREHKPEVLSWLEATGAGLPRDQAPWLHIAKQVMAGEWDGADLSTIESITIGLRSIQHPLCKQALTRLPDNEEKP